MNEYRINCVQLGNIVNGRCLEAEKKLNEVLGGALQVLSVTPYTIVSPSQPMMNNGRLMTMPPNLICALVAVSEHLVPDKVENNPLHQQEKQV